MIIGNNQTISHLGEVQEKNDTLNTQLNVVKSVIATQEVQNEDLRVSHLEKDMYQSNALAMQAAHANMMYNSLAVAPLVAPPILPVVNPLTASVVDPLVASTVLPGYNPLVASTMAL